VEAIAHNFSAGTVFFFITGESMVPLIILDTYLMPLLNKALLFIPNAKFQIYY
jgi:hypothetical protein